MSGLSEQILIIRKLAQATAIQRAHLSAACQTIHPSTATVHKTLCIAGTALIAADTIPGITACGKLFLKNAPADRRTQRIRFFRQVPRLLRTLRRLRP